MKDYFFRLQLYSLTQRIRGIATSPVVEGSSPPLLFIQLKKLRVKNVVR